MSKEIKGILKINIKDSELVEVTETLEILKKHIKGLELNLREELKKLEYITNSTNPKYNVGMVIAEIAENNWILEADLTVKDEKTIKKLKKVLKKEGMDYKLDINE
ncbi:MAG: hypothetical protein R6U26_03515 [Candidatus Undinarchaeales archaeon]